jgi:hypothetical protein
MRFNLTEKEYKEYKTKIMLILKVKRMCIHYLIIIILIAEFR